jgi:fructose-1,6-bisphosphatase-3
MILAEHKPYQPIKPDGTQEFTAPSMKIVYTLPERKSIIDTDSGKRLAEQVEDLLELIQAFKEGLIKEEY